ncbi:MAG: hypothetical protein KGM91_23215 [Burkholderiales bacterium]|nr:hypothetical protein [Burkholderiales bacterium]
MPLSFLRSRAFAELSPHAAKMLLDLCAGLGPNASGNGDLNAAPATMRPKGWSSDATRRAALQELERAALIVATRQGNRRACTLYAVTLWPMQCDLSKLDHGPGAFTTLDWIKVAADRADRPTLTAPATWNVLRKSAIGAPATGQPHVDMSPPRDNPPVSDRRLRPATGSIDPFSAARVGPPRDTFLDLPSVPASNRASSPPRLTSAGTRMGRFMARVRLSPDQRPAGYAVAAARTRADYLAHLQLKGTS